MGITVAGWNWGGWNCDRVELEWVDSGRGQRGSAEGNIVDSGSSLLLNPRCSVRQRVRQVIV